MKETFSSIKPAIRSSGIYVKKIESSVLLVCFQILQQQVRFLYSFLYIPVCPEREGVENKMTDNLKVKASKAVDDAKVAAHAAYDDAAVATHNILKGGGKETQKVSDDVKTGVHKAVADAKIAAHKAESQLKKK
jgi:hypothetical protein